MLITILLLSQCKLQKKIICENIEVMCIHIIVHGQVCAQVLSVSLQSDIANYWPGMQNTTFVLFSQISVSSDLFNFFVVYMNMALIDHLQILIVIIYSPYCHYKP